MSGEGIGGGTLEEDIRERALEEGVFEEEIIG